MESTAVYAKLSEVFHSVFDDDEITVTPQLTADDVDGWDSLKHVRLLLSVERAFGIKFAASEVSKLENVGQLAKVIQAKL